MGSTRSERRDSKTRSTITIFRFSAPRSLWAWLLERPKSPRVAAQLPRAVPRHSLLAPREAFLSRPQRSLIGLSRYHPQSRFARATVSKSISLRTCFFLRTPTTLFHRRFKEAFHAIRCPLPLAPVDYEQRRLPKQDRESEEVAGSVQRRIPRVCQVLRRSRDRR